MSDDPNRTAGGDVRDDVNRAGSRLAEDARSTAQSAMSQASHYAQDRAHDARDGVAGEVSDIASALRKAADSTRGGSFQEQAFQALAGTLADTADSIKSKEPGDMLAEVGRFARANPLAFLGVATLVGFAASRVAGATQRPRGTGSDYEYGTTRGTPDTYGETTRPYSSTPGSTSRPYGSTPGEYGARTPASPEQTPGLRNDPMKGGL
ncbi:hypothetical protein LX81_02069 [Palleronia aestuarii]|uniref:Nutrient deprivation-induced protein n=1 Tax=Palleronia aestuarii TaxID=568105 RepID=A0A2W7N818_9RHOB|nr:hypothetical protein [Palleronia aestuarii]PZX16218.1 hypothetical protein LX81_02069 [Palleronia aestuarii]